MRRRAVRNRQAGSILIFVIILSMCLAFAVTLLLQRAEVEARATNVRMGSIRALYRAYAELEKAKTVIGTSEYDSEGRNSAVQAALARPDGKIEGTDVVVEPLTGTTGTWYSMTATMPYAGDYERVVRQAFREIDFFSSYNLFVSEHPAGISGSPIGAIHSNKAIQFYFPGGVYRHSVTSANGFDYRSGATAENTEISGPFNPSSGRIEIDYDGSDRYSLRYIEVNADPDFSFDETLDTRLRLFIQNGEQWVHVERWTKPRTETVTEQVIVGYNNVNPRDEPYSWTERVKTGSEEKSREIQVLDHYDTVMEDAQVPVYVDDVRDVQVPVYKTETRTRDVPVYRTETRTRMVTRTVWVPVADASGGTTVAGDSGNLGYWAPQQVEESYTVSVIDHYDTQTYQVTVLDRYDTQQQPYRRLDRYDTVQQPRQVEVFRTQTEYFTEDTFEDVVRNGTRTVYDEEPVYLTQTKTNYIAAQRQLSADLPVPDNGLIFCKGRVTSLSGNIIERVTVATADSVLITGDLVYRDGENDSAYLHGKEPWLPYEPNPAYSSQGILGIIAANDVLYSRNVPDNFEINASMLSIGGRVGIEGIILDEPGEVSGYNQLTDEFGRPVSSTFRKNSVRRLGGITTAFRPVETVVKDGSIRSGFDIGQSVFDVGLLEGPPPFFLAYPVPRFFATSIVK